MAFKMKGIGSVSNIKPPASKSTPFYQQNEFTITKDETTGNNGNTVQNLTREKTIKGEQGQEVETIETDNQKFIDSFRPEYSRLIETGEFTGTIEEFIAKKSEKYQDTEDEIVIEDRTITNNQGEQGEIVKTEIIERPPGFFEVADATGFVWEGREKTKFNTEQGKVYFEFFDDMARSLTMHFADKEYWARNGRLKFNNVEFDNGGLLDGRVAPGQSQHLLFTLMDVYEENPEALQAFLQKNGFAVSADNIEEEVEVIEEIATPATSSDTNWQTRTKTN